MKIARSSIAVLLAFSGFAAAEGTQQWKQSSYDEFAKGSAKGIAIHSRGKLTMAPAFDAVFTSPSTFLWSIVSDDKGNAFLAAGAPARVYRVDAKGKATIIFEPKELQVQALAIDAAGAVYAATSPDGKVYKIEAGSRPALSRPAEIKKDAEAKKSDTDPVTLDASYTATPFFEPKTKYIWTMALDHDGRLYVATGDRGEIFRVEKDGKGSLFFKSEEAHIRSLAFDGDGNLIAGSDGSGLIYRIKPNGEAFVLYSAPKKEITALAVDHDGYIFAAGSGDKHPINIGAPSGPPGMGGGTAGALPIAMLPIMNLGVSGGSEIYMIAPDGLPRKIWAHKDELVYALTIDNSGALLAGSGNRGRIFRIERDGTFADLQKASANQVTGFAPAPEGALYAVTSNLGKMFRLATKPAGDSSYESDVFDAAIFSRWGRAQVRGSGDFDFFARTGNVDNPDRNWSPWSKVDLTKESELRTPPARFVQWRVVMHASHPEAEVESVKIAYRSQNVAPVVDDIVVVPGARFTPSMVSSQRMNNETINIGFAGSTSNSGMIGNSFASSIPAQKDRGSIAVRWAAHDENDDELLYSLYYRGDGEREWKLLKDKITDKFYSWDSELLPDGGYTMKVIATDAPSHTPEEALSDSRESNRFEIDNTPPQVEALTAKLDAGQIHISFTAKDSFSQIKRAEFSVDAGEWQFIEPVGLLSDSTTETYDFNVPAPGVKPEARSEAGDPGEANPEAKPKHGKRPATLAAAPPSFGEHLVVVRVYDRFDNMAAAKVLVK